MKTFTYKGKKYALLSETYFDNYNTAIDVYERTEDDWEFYGSATVNLGETLMPDSAYLDTESLPEVEDMLRKAKVIKGKPVTRKQSGYATFPLYDIDLSKLN